MALPLDFLAPMPVVTMRLLSRTSGVEEYAMRVEYKRPARKLRVPEAAALLGCSRHTVYRMLRDGVLQGENIGVKLTRVHAESVLKLIADGQDKVF